MLSAILFLCFVRLHLNICGSLYLQAHTNMGIFKCHLIHNDTIFKCQPSKHVKMSHYRPASATPVGWRFAGEGVDALFAMFRTFLVMVANYNRFGSG